MSKRKMKRREKKLNLNPRTIENLKLKIKQAQKGITADIRLSNLDRVFDWWFSGSVFDSALGFGLIEEAKLKVQKKDRAEKVSIRKKVTQYKLFN